MASDSATASRRLAAPVRGPATRPSPGEFCLERRPKFGGFLGGTLRFWRAVAVRRPAARRQRRQAASATVPAEVTAAVRRWSDCACCSANRPSASPASNARPSSARCRAIVPWRVAARHIWRAASASGALSASMAAAIRLSAGAARPRWRPPVLHVVSAASTGAALRVAPSWPRRSPGWRAARLRGWPAAWRRPQHRQHGPHGLRERRRSPVRFDRIACGGRLEQPGLELLHDAARELVGRLRSFGDILAFEPPPVPTGVVPAPAAPVALAARSLASCRAAA